MILYKNYSSSSSTYDSASASSSPSRASSFYRDDGGGKRASIRTANLFRSRSEGNLAADAVAAGKKQQGLGNLATPLDRCIRAIYGSWRNLMQRKSSPSFDSAQQ